MDNTEKIVPERMDNPDVCNTISYSTPPTLRSRSRLPLVSIILFCNECYILQLVKEGIIINASIYCLTQEFTLSTISKNSFRVVHICSKIKLVMFLRVAHKQPLENKINTEFNGIFVCFDIDFFM